jgi:hypothetical protein
MPTKVANISIAEINSSTVTNCVISNVLGGLYVVPEYKTHMGNVTSDTTVRPDRPISLTGFKVDENYIIATSWGEGFGVARINSDGTATEIYHDNTPLNNYIYYVSLAIDKTRKLAIIGNHVYDNLKLYNFNGDWENTPTTTTLTEASAGLPSDEVGYSYVNGLAIAGDWLYISPDDTSFSNVKRWNTQTSGSEDLVRTGSHSTIGRGAWYYDEPRDRMFHQPQTSYASYLTCVISASSYTDAKAYTIRWDTAGLSSGYGRGDGVAVDEDNPNQLWVVGYYRAAKIDITNCLLDAQDPSYTNQATKILPTGTPINWSVDFPIATPFTTNTYLRLATHPDVDTIWLIPDRNGLDYMYGFIDTEDGNPVFIPSDDGTEIAPNNPFGTSYGNWFQKVTSGGSSYWVTYGYGNDGYKLNIWDASSVSPELFDTWSFESNAIQMDSSQNITRVNIDPDSGITVPPNSTLTVSVSNNNGDTWETYGTLGTEHEFQSTGNQFKVRVQANGSTSSSPRIMGKGLKAVLSDQLALQRPINRRNRTSGFKLAGN